jgi:hypothetical protein
MLTRARFRWEQSKARQSPSYNFFGRCACSGERAGLLQRADMLFVTPSLRTHPRQTVRQTSSSSEIFAWETAQTSHIIGDNPCRDFPELCDGNEHVRRKAQQAITGGGRGEGGGQTYAC